jgi:hypothetical protein
MWPVKSGDRAMVSGGGIKISDATYVVYRFPPLRSVITESQWRHAYCWTDRRDVVATSAQRWRVELQN